MRKSHQPFGLRTVITEIEGDQMKAQRVSGVAMSRTAAVKLRDQLSSMIDDLKTKGVLQDAPNKH